MRPPRPACEAHDLPTAGPPPPRLKKRSEFLKAAKAARTARRAVVLQARRREDDGPARFGFTATKKIGGAVQRNRAKRRLREAIRVLAPHHAHAGTDYVLIARRDTADLEWARLLDDVKSALITLRSGAAESGSAAHSALETSAAPGVGDAPTRRPPRRRV